MVRRAGAGVALCVGRPVVERAGGANSHLVNGDSGGALTCLSGLRLMAAAGGGERCRGEPPLSGRRGRPGGSTPQASAGSGVRRGRRPAAAPRSGSTGGGLGHSAAMIASNSARSSSSSAQSSSTNCFAVIGVVSPAGVRMEGMTVIRQPKR